MILETLPYALMVYAFVLSAAYVAFSSARLEKRTRRLIHRIIAPDRPGPPQHISFDRLNRLPPPVARYLRLALTPGHRAPRRVRISQDGELRLANKRKAWKWYSARQYLQADTPAYVWDARVDLMPFADLRVVDSYQQGRAALRVKLMSSLPLIEDENRPELVQSALIRYLAEAVWCPSILLPRPELQWEAIDETTARATLTDGGLSVSVVFHFNDRNEVEKVVAEGRYRAVDGGYVSTRWTGFYKEYADCGDMHIPLRCAAQWNLADEDFTYWRGRVRSIEYDPRPTVWE